MTRTFMHYLEEYDLNQQSSINFDKTYIKRDSLALPGKAIFDILFKGTACRYPFLV